MIRNCWTRFGIKDDYIVGMPTKNKREPEGIPWGQPTQPLDKVCEILISVDLIV